MGCPFCNVAESDRVLETELLIGFFDRFPVNPGHLLLITRRHVETWFDATKEEQAALKDIDAAIEIFEKLESRLKLARALVVRRWLEERGVCFERVDSDLH